MDESTEKQIGLQIAHLMVFYKGAISYKELRDMSIIELKELNEYAEQINNEIDRRIKESSKG